MDELAGNIGVPQFSICCRNVAQEARAVEAKVEARLRKKFWRSVEERGFPNVVLEKEKEREVSETNIVKKNSKV